MALKGSSAVRAGLARPSGWVLIAVNFGILLGVLLFDWSAFDIIFLFWAENVIIGIINVLKMLLATPSLGAAGRNLGAQARMGMLAGNIGIKLFLVPFFIVHYGGFCLGHGVFVFALFNEAGEFGDDLFTALPELVTGAMGLSLLLLAFSHLMSFFLNYIKGGEFMKTSPAELMGRPYGRIIALHVTILLGGFLTMAMGDPTWMLLLLVILKTFVDLAMHGRERQKYESIEGRSGPGTINPGMG